MSKEWEAKAANFRAIVRRRQQRTKSGELKLLLPKRKPGQRCRVCWNTVGSYECKHWSGRNTAKRGGSGGNSIFSPDGRSKQTENRKTIKWH